MPPAAEVDAGLQPEFSDELLSPHCVLLPADTGGATWALADCAGAIGKLDLANGDFTELAAHEGVLAFAAVTDAHAIFIDEHALKSVPLVGGELHELSPTPRASVFAITHDGQTIVFRVEDDSNVLHAVAVSGDEPEVTLTDTESYKHRLPDDERRLLFMKSGRLASVDVHSGEAIDLAPSDAALISRDGMRVAWVDESSSKLELVAADGGDAREWSEPDATPLAVLGFTRDGAQLLVKDSEGLGLLRLESGEWSRLATPPNGALMQLDIAPQHAFLQYALGKIDGAGDFPDGFGFAAVPLNGDAVTTIAQFGARYFRDYMWNSPLVFADDLSEATFPGSDGGLSLIDLDSLDVRVLAGSACSATAASGASPDRKSIFFWVCDDRGYATSLHVVDRDGALLSALDEIAYPTPQFAPDSRHFVVTGADGVWLSSVNGPAEKLTFDAPTTAGLHNPYFPAWHDSQHLVYNHDGAHVVRVHP